MGHAVVFTPAPPVQQRPAWQDIDLPIAAKPCVDSRHAPAQARPSQEPFGARVRDCGPTPEERCVFHLFSTSTVYILCYGGPCFRMHEQMCSDTSIVPIDK